MSRKPKIDHEYHADKDKMKITNSGVFAEQNVSRHHHEETDGAA